MLFVVLLALILLGPIGWVAVQSIRRRDIGAPRHESASESESMIQLMKDIGDTRTGGRGLS